MLDYCEGVKILFCHFLHKPPPPPCDVINNRSLRAGFQSGLRIVKVDFFGGRFRFVFCCVADIANSVWLV